MMPTGRRGGPQPPPPHAPGRGCSALPKPDTHSGARWTGTASLAGKPARTLGRGEDMFGSPGQTLSPFGTSSHPWPPPFLPAPAHSNISRGLNPLPPHSLGHPRGSIPKDQLSPHHVLPLIPIPFYWPRPDPPHGPQGLQYSPSAQEHRSLRGCQAHPRRKENIEGSAPEGRREQP